jgi:hypothetical protein
VPEPVSLRKSDDAERFTELLPWYLNGTLSDSERHWVERYMQAHPNAQSEYEWLRTIKDDVQENSPTASDDKGLAETLARIRAEVPSRRLHKLGWLARLGEAIAPRRMTPLGYAALALIAGQAALLIHFKQLLSERYSEVREVRVDNDLQEGRLVRLTFNANAREEDIRLALAQVGGRIVGGPGRLGDYYVHIESAVDEAIVKLTAAPAVEAVVRVRAVPERD